MYIPETLKVEFVSRCPSKTVVGGESNIFVPNLYAVDAKFFPPDTKNSVGLVGCIEEVAHNAIAVYWNPLESAAKVRRRPNFEPHQLSRTREDQTLFSFFPSKRPAPFSSTTSSSCDRLSTCSYRDDRSPRYT